MAFSFPPDEDQRSVIGAGSAREVPPQSDNSEHAHDPDDDHGRFEGARRHVAERQALALPLGERVDRDGRADAGDGRQDLQGRTQRNLRVAARADDVVLVVQERRVQQRPWNGEHERSDEEPTGDLREPLGVRPLHSDERP